MTAAVRRRHASRSLLAAVVLGLQLALGLNWMMVTPLFPLLMDELAVDRATVSLLFGSVALAQAAGTVPAGWLTLRVGVRGTLGLGAALMAAGLAIPALASFPALLAARIVFGLGTGLFVPAAAAFAVQRFAARELPVFNSLALVAVGIGNSAGLLLAVPLSEALGWRGALTACAGLCALLALLWAAFSREARPPQPAAMAERTPSLAGALRQPAAYWLAAAFAGAISFFDALAAWLPTYYVEAYGMDLTQGSAITGLTGLAGIPASLAGGFAAARLGVRRPLIAASGLLMAPAGAALFLLSDPALLAAAALAFGFAVWFFTPALFTIPMELPRMTPGLVAAVTGLIMTITGVCSFFAPIVVGFLADRTGSYLPGFALYLVGSWAVLLAAWRLPETGPGGG